MNLKNESDLHQEYRYTMRERVTLFILGGLACGSILSLIALLIMEVIG